MIALTYYITNSRMIYCNVDKLLSKLLCFQVAKCMTGMASCFKTQLNTVAWLL